MHQIGGTKGSLNWNGNGSLAPELLDPRKRGKQPPRMTAVIGFPFLEGVILASDSQMSYEGTFIQPDYKKIVTLGEGHNRVIIGKSGAQITADAFQEEFDMRLIGLTLDSSRSISLAADEAMKVVRTKFMQQFFYHGVSDQAILQHRLNMRACVMYSYFYQGQSYLYTIESDTAYSNIVRHPFSAIGCAANIASYVLSGLKLNELTYFQAIGAALYCIEICKKHDSGCGGAAQIATIVTSLDDNDPLIGEPPFELDQDMMSIVSKIESEVFAFTMNKIKDEFTPPDE